MQLHIQYLTNAAGATTAVQIPFQEWKKLTDDYKHLQQCEQVKTDLDNAFSEIFEIEKGRKKTLSLKGFLNEC